MSHGFTLIVTDDNTCPGVEVSRLGNSFDPNTVSGYLHGLNHIRHWITFTMGTGAGKVYVLDMDEHVPEHLMSRCMTFTVDEKVYRQYEQARANG